MAAPRAILRPRVCFPASRPAAPERPWAEESLAGHFSRRLLDYPATGRVRHKRLRAWRPVTPIPTVPVPVTIRPRRTPRLGIIAQATGLGSRQNLAFVDPALDADHAVGGVRLAESEIDIRAQRVQRKLPLQIPFRTRDFRAVQTSGNPDLNSLAAEAQRGVDSLAHGSAKRHAFFELQRDRFGNQLRVQLRLVDFLNIDEDFALGLLGQILLQLFDFRALAPDDDSGTGSVNSDAQLIAGTIDFDRADAGGLQALAQGVLELQILAQELGVILLGEPPRPPGLGEAQPESVWMYFLPHIFILRSPSPRRAGDPRPGPRCAPFFSDSGTHGPSEPHGSASCAALHSRNIR